MAEMFMLSPLFPGSSELDQLHKLCIILGTPDEEEWPEGYTEAMKRGITIPQGHLQKDLEKILKYACPEAIDLLESLLRWNPKKRPTCD